jgi:hypothetical protein
MKRLGVPFHATRLAPRTDITQKLLQMLYIEQGMNQREIADLLDCSAPTVRKYLCRYGIPLYSQAQVSSQYPRRNFDGSPAEKAYLIGFRQGDLHVRKALEASETISIACPTTRQEQIDLIRSLFSPYGNVHVGKADSKGQHTVDARLNLSFDFLLPKQDVVPSWIQQVPACAAAFAAGYIDAEGSFYTWMNAERQRECAGFTLESQDKNIVCWLHGWLASNGVVCCSPPKVKNKAGEKCSRGYTYHKDIWVIVVRRIDSLLRLIEALGPHLRHSKRRADMERVRQNVLERNRGWRAKKAT